MQKWMGVCALACLMAGAQVVSAQSITFAQFTQPQSAPEFAVLQNPNNFTFSTVDTTVGVPINFSALVPAVAPQPATLILNAVSTSSSGLSGTGSFGVIAFDNPLNDTLTIKDALGNTLLSANFTGDLFINGVSGSSILSTASFDTTEANYGPGTYPTAGKLGGFSIALSGLNQVPTANGFLAAGAGTFDVNPVPEPASLSTLLVGLGALAIRRRRKQSQS